MAITPFTKTVQKTFYRTSDGKEFDNEYIAKEHEKEYRAWHDGDRRKCERCGGSGKLNCRREKHWGPDFIGCSESELWYEAYDTCPDCRGKGYLERKVVWE